MAVQDVPFLVVIWVTRPTWSSGRARVSPLKRGPHSLPVLDLIGESRHGGPPRSPDRDLSPSCFQPCLFPPAIDEAASTFHKLDLRRGGGGILS